MVRVRDAGGDDVEAIAELLARLWYPSPPVTVGERLRAVVSGWGGVVVAADDAGQVMGLASYDVWFALAVGAKVCRLSSLVVAQAAERVGVGRALVAEIERRALDRRCSLIELSSGRRADRDAAHRFYEALGYTDACDHHACYTKPLTSPTT